MSSLCTACRGTGDEEVEHWQGDDVQRHTIHCSQCRGTGSGMTQIELHKKLAEEALWLADKIPAYGDYAKDAARVLRALVETASAHRDAYEGAREDLLDWKRRALLKESAMTELLAVCKETIEAFMSGSPDELAAVIQSLSVVLAKSGTGRPM